MVDGSDGIKPLVYVPQRKEPEARARRRPKKDKKADEENGENTKRPSSAQDEETHMIDRYV